MEGVMGDQNTRWKEWMVVGTTTLGVVALLPLVGVTLFLLRFVIAALAAAAIVVGVVLFAASGRFRRWFATVVEPEIEYKGMRLATAVSLDRNHSWARVEPDGTFVGADPLALACLGPLDKVELPTAGSRVDKDQVLFTLGHGTRELSLHSPLPGTVVARNEALLSEPNRVNDDPFGLGWVVRVRGDDPRASRRSLLRGRRAKDWFRDEVDRLVATLGSGPATLPTLPDGGVLADGIHRAIDDATWDRIRAEFFEGHHARAATGRQGGVTS
jgi:glycine cleavage system H protein